MDAMSMSCGRTDRRKGESINSHGLSSVGGEDGGLKIVKKNRGYNPQAIKLFD